MFTRATTVRRPSLPSLTFELKRPTCLHTCSMAAIGAVMLGTRDLRGHGSFIEDGWLRLKALIIAIIPLPARLLSAEREFDETSQRDGTCLVFTDHGSDA